MGCAEPVLFIGEVRRAPCLVLIVNNAQSGLHRTAKKAEDYTRKLLVNRRPVGAHGDFFLLAIPYDHCLIANGAALCHGLHA
jgi:hypothetical protein